jgi:hypothetical protein
VSQRGSCQDDLVVRGVKPALLAEILQNRIDEERAKRFHALQREAITKLHLSFPDPAIRPNPQPVIPKK